MYVMRMCVLPLKDKNNPRKKKQYLYFNISICIDTFLYYIAKMSANVSGDDST